MVPEVSVRAISLILASLSLKIKTLVFLFQNSGIGLTSNGAFCSTQRMFKSKVTFTSVLHFFHEYSLVWSKY